MFPRVDLKKIRMWRGQEPYIKELPQRSYIPIWNMYESLDPIADSISGIFSPEISIEDLKVELFKPRWKNLIRLKIPHLGYWDVRNFDRFKTNSFNYGGSLCFRLYTSSVEYDLRRLQAPGCPDHSICKRIK
jgi:hypothetical protein